MKKLLSIGGVIGFFALVLAGAMLLQGLSGSAIAWSWPGLAAIGKVCLFFGGLGCFIGVIAAFDQASDFCVSHQPMLRTLICSVFGLGLAFFLNNSFAHDYEAFSLAAGGLAGAMLGWFGWRWARFVEYL